MILRTMIPAALLVGGIAAALPAAVPAMEAGAGLIVRAAVDQFAETVAEYEEAVDGYKARIKAAEDAKAKNEIRRNHPAKEYWSRFEELGKSGEGRAYFWMATHVREYGIKSKERGEILAGLYGKIVTKHASADWFGDVLTRINKDGKYLGTDKVTELYQTALEKAEGDSAKAAAMYWLGASLADSDDEKVAAEGERWLKKVMADFPKTAWGTMASGRFITAEDLEPGKPAPDFFGQTIDGHQFNLSDYRGKVVMLDFYGFW